MFRFKKRKITRYLIEGHIDFEDTSSYIPVTDAEITHLLPGAKLRTHRVLWMLVNGNLLHGFCLL